MALSEDGRGCIIIERNVKLTPMKIYITNIVRVAYSIHDEPPGFRNDWFVARMTAYNHTHTHKQRVATIYSVADTNSPLVISTSIAPTKRNN